MRERKEKSELGEMVLGVGGGREREGCVGCGYEM